MAAGARGKKDQGPRETLSDPRSRLWSLASVAARMDNTKAALPRGFRFSFPQVSVDPRQHTVLMNTSHPPHLFDLAKQSLLKDESWVPVAAQLIPFRLWEHLFVEAMSGRHSEIMKAMVASWPSPCLDLDTLITDQQFHPLTLLSSVFKGLEVLLDQGPRHAAGQLSVLWPTIMEEESEIEFIGALEYLEMEKETPRKRKREDCSMSAPRKAEVAVEVVADLIFDTTEFYDLLSFLMWRVLAGKVLPRLCCQKLSFSDNLPHYEVTKKILQSVQLDGVERLKICLKKRRDFLSVLAPYLSQMVHLKTLQLQHFMPQIWTSRRRTLNKGRAEELESIFMQFTSQLAHLRQLQHLHVDNVYLCGNIHHFLRHLEAPLETLSISFVMCLLENADIKSLSLYPCTSKLKALSFYNTTLAHINPDFLRAAIDRTSATLERLDLAHCKLTDSHLNAILPALSHCSQLQLFRFSGNCVGKSTLKKLLRRTVPTRKSRRLVLPLPYNMDRKDSSSLVSEFALLLKQLGVLSQVKVYRYQPYILEFLEVLMELS
ncbi:PREDICTED: melanoma antigen preferentially expressed in tumors-like [Elephantulus edwardii]|uniref:melanoma antigen preferentially expressed in tumors-like n=1 Tax=Elephantulus edwardii TaxID=28737 RepID=UPI0003F0D59B|nr:PREDICTED: melanoma antigen preferentially expressed in tumors-like [Elephantulus edwardii]